MATVRYIIFTIFGDEIDNTLLTNRVDYPVLTDHFSIIGAGVAGLTCACELLDRGKSVTVYERASTIGEQACSWYAGGMLAPWCERESAAQAVVELGLQSTSWWQKHVSGVIQNGSLVLSPKRDLGELKRFARLTEQYSWLDSEAISELEPDLSGRFEQALLFASEAHLNPRQALSDMAQYIVERGGTIELGHEVSAEDFSDRQEIVVDCRGYAAKHALPSLRGVKGEMLILHCPEISFSRPIRLLHPRYPMYLVPREDHQFMLGATMIENSERNRISARSMLELLSVVYALHPAFGEAEVVEIGVDVRPSFNNNLPQLSRRGNVIYMNGLYRHGFLLSPAMAGQVADAATNAARFEALPLCA